MPDETTETEETTELTEEQQAAAEAEAEAQRTKANVDTTAATNAEIMRRQMQVISDQQVELERLREVSNKPAPVPETPVTSSEFLNDPVKHIDDRVSRQTKIILDEMKKSIEPLNKFRVQVERNDVYSELKRQARQLPEYKDLIEELEPEIDAIMSKQGEVNASTFQTAVVLAAGSRAIQGKPVKKTASRSSEQEDRGVTAGLPSSPPKAPVKDSDKATKFTEDERAYMRAMKLTDAEMIHLRNASDEVDSWILPEPKKKEGTK